MKMITGSTVRTTAPKGRMIYTPGETGEVLFLLCEGAVHLYSLSSEGRKFIVQTIGPMTFFGEMTLVAQNMYDLYAEAAEDSTICVMSRTDVERLILWKPQVAIRMLEEIGQRLHEVQERLGDIAFKGLIARLASLLLREAEGNEITGLSHEDIAERLGVYRETVANVLKELKTAGIIEIGRKHITITNRPRLERAASE